MRKKSKYIRRKDDTLCFACGIPCFPEYHHIVPKYADGNEDGGNIIPLCVSCHSAIHHLAGTISFAAWVSRALNDCGRDGKLIVLKAANYIYMANEDIKKSMEETQPVHDEKLIDIETRLFKKLHCKQEDT